MGAEMDGFENQSARWLESRIEGDGETDLEIGSLIAAASEWTEDEMELEDLVSGLVETGCVQLQIG